VETLSTIHFHLFVFAAALLLSLAATPVARAVAVSVGFYDAPGAKKAHRDATPLLGGAAIFLAFGVAIAAAAWSDPLVRAMLAGCAIVFALGLWDDRCGLRPLVKLSGQILAAVVAIALGLRLDLSGQALVDVPLMVFWMVGITNALNLSDNMDGLSAGLAAIGAAGFCAAASLSGNYSLAMVTLALCGACVGFLRYNFSPATIFMGDAGSMVIGFALSVIGVRAVSAPYLPMAPLIPILVLGVPIFDTGLVSWLRYREGRSIGDGGTDHTSHRLRSLGLSVRQTTVILYSAASVLSVAACVTLVTGPWVALSALVVLGSLAFVAGHALARATSADAIRTRPLEAP